MGSIPRAISVRRRRCRSLILLACQQARLADFADEGIYVTRFENHNRPIGCGSTLTIKTAQDLRFQSTIPWSAHQSVLSRKCRTGDIWIAGEAQDRSALFGRRRITALSHCRNAFDRRLERSDAFELRAWRVLRKAYHSLLGRQHSMIGSPGDRINSQLFSPAFSPSPSASSLP